MDKTQLPEGLGSSYCLDGLLREHFVDWSKMETDDEAINGVWHHLLERTC